MVTRLEQLDAAYEAVSAFRKAQENLHPLRQALRTVRQSQEEIAAERTQRSNTQDGHLFFGVIFPLPVRIRPSTNRPTTWTLTESGTTQSKSLR